MKTVNIYKVVLALLAIDLIAQSLIKLEGHFGAIPMTCQFKWIGFAEHANRKIEKIKKTNGLAWELLLEKFKHKNSNAHGLELF